MQIGQSYSVYLLPVDSKGTTGMKKAVAGNDRTALSDVLRFKVIGCIDGLCVMFWDVLSGKRIAAAWIMPNFSEEAPRRVQTYRWEY